MRILSATVTKTAAPLGHPHAALMVHVLDLLGQYQRLPSAHDRRRKVMEEGRYS